MRRLTPDLLAGLAAKAEAWLVGLGATLVGAACIGLPPLAFGFLRIGAPSSSPVWKNPSALTN